MTFSWVPYLANMPLASLLVLKMTILLIAAWFLQACLAKRNPRWRVFAWRAVFFGLLVLPMAELIGPNFQFDISLPLAASEPSMKNPVIPNSELSGWEPSAPVLASAEALPQTGTTTRTHPDVSIAAPVTGSVSRQAGPHDVYRWMKDRVSVLLVAAWVLGVLALAMRTWCGTFRVRRIVQTAQPAPERIRRIVEEVADATNCRIAVDIRITHSRYSPFLTGVLRIVKRRRVPVIVLPKRMTHEDFERELPMILAHELSHLRSRDLEWTVVAKVLSVLLWFHPLAWKMRSAHAQACEQVCDAMAAAYMGGAAPYSRALARTALEFAAGAPAPGVLPMFRSSEITRRLRTLEQGIRCTNLKRQWTVVLVSFGCAFLLGLAGVTLVHAEQAVKDAPDRLADEPGTLFLLNKDARDHSGVGGGKPSASRRNTDTALEEPSPIDRFALAFDGADDFMETSDNEAHDIGDGFTVEVWLKVNAAQGECAIFSKEVPWKTGWTLLVDGTDENSGSYDLTFGVGNGRRFYNVTAPGVLERGQWRHVAVTRDTRRTRLFVDGEMVGMVMSARAAVPARVPLRIGKGSADLNRHFSGMIAGIRIWNVALDEPSIQSHLTERLSDNLPSVVGFWPFNDGKGQQAHDISPSYSHARLGASDMPDSADPEWVSAELDVPSAAQAAFLEVIRQDWRTLQTNMSVSETPLRIGERSFDHGLGTHAVSHIRVHSPEPIARFTAWVGLDDDSDYRGSVDFSVLAEEEELYRSGVLRLRDKAERIDIPTHGAKVLDLRVGVGGDDYTCDHADWAEAAITLQSGKNIRLDELNRRDSKAIARNTLVFPEALILPVPTKATQTVLYVHRANTSGLEDGVSWETAFATIQPAIDAASASGGGEVWVAAGQYDEARNNDTGSIQMRDRVSLYGGFRGTETSRDERDWKTNKTILDGSKARDGQPAYHVVVGADNATLDGFTITGGNANHSGNSMHPDNYGGGMTNLGTSPTVANCTFVNNRAENSGAGMFNVENSPTIVNCIFMENANGGMRNKFGSSPTIINCVFLENTISDGINNYYSSPRIIGCLFVDNTPNGVGSEMSTPSLVNCTFARNSGLKERVGDWEWSVGSGLVNYNGTNATVSNCIFWQNSPVAIRNSSASAKVTFSLVQGGYPGEGNIDTAPLFVDSDAGDYSLSWKSPCVDSGITRGAPATDMRGIERPQNEGIDMGAYEYEG